MQLVNGNLMYKSPTCPEEYWNNVNIYWDDILHIINVYLPTFSKKWIDGTNLDTTLGDHIAELKATRNPKLVRALNAAWWNCPEEKSGDWAHDSWYVLCDLCSEEWCLHEPKELDE